MGSVGVEAIPKSTAELIDSVCHRADMQLAGSRVVWFPPPQLL